MPFDMYQRLVCSLADVRTLVLNYSGESTYYPELIPAIRTGHEAGAWVELVSVLASATPGLVSELGASGLNRLTVSVHTTDADQFREIYRYSSLTALETRLRELMVLPGRPAVDFGFVAMDANVDQLVPVGTLARSMGVDTVLIFPVMRRDPIPAEFLVELGRDGRANPEFRRTVAAAVASAESQLPDVRFTVCVPAFSNGTARLGAVPMPYPEPLPTGACIHSCEQNPFETAHVLSNGDVVPCEVLDRRVMGNLAERDIGEIWNSEAYSEFRRSYRAGEIAECRTCAWKQVYLPAPLASDIIGSRGRNPQLLWGWHEPDDSGTLWSSQRAAARLRPRRGSRVLHVSGMLAPGCGGAANVLTICCNGREVGRVENPWGETIPFGLDFAVEGTADEWLIEFRTRFAFRPSENAAGRDNRDLGFALTLLTSKAPETMSNAAAAEALRKLIDRVDAMGRLQRRRRVRHPQPPPGVSVIIPERDNPEELARCLASVDRAARGVDEPFEVIVVVNGTPRARYSPAADGVRWIFDEASLGFTGAVRRGLRVARYGWVYLLNNDAELETDAFRALLPLRSCDVFAVASQIFLKDTTRFREETNLTELCIEDGLAAVHDLVPSSQSPVESFYAGGGASLFQRSLLARFLTSAYEPFYWEDVEWGWRARKLGYHILFCPASVAHHTQRGTISRHWSPDEIEMIIERNRLLFQLRNMADSGSAQRLFDEIARLPAAALEWFRRPRITVGIAASRLWNLRAPVRDSGLPGV